MIRFRIEISSVGQYVAMLVAALLIGGIAASAAPGGTMRDTEIKGNLVVFRTESMIAEVEAGRITRLYNRLTGTEYLIAPSGDAPKGFETALIYVQPGKAASDQTPATVGPSPTVKGTDILEPAPVPIDALSSPTVTPRDHGAAFVFGDAHAGLTVEYALDPDTGDLLVTLRGDGTREQLSGIRFGLGPVTCHGDLLLPSFHGIKASRGDDMAKFESKRWEWPSGWPIPVLVFNDPAGGLWIYTRDIECRYKAYEYLYEGHGAWRLALDTLNPAPFAVQTQAQSVTWRINTYRGSWTEPVDCYARWAYQAYGIPSKAFARPAWVDDLRLVVKRADQVDLKNIESYLDNLSRYVEPSQTLLHTRPFEAKEPVMPHWQVGQRGARFNEEARKRGFHTMYFANYFSITSNHPRFKEFEPYIMRDPYTGEKQGWNLKGEWSAATDIELYYINPAYKPWRDFQIGEFKALFATHPADGLFIDQSFVVFNDGNGPIDGMSCVDGNLAFHRELAEALPGAAIGGEGVNEVSFQYESVAEFHILA